MHVYLKDYPDVLPLPALTLNQKVWIQIFAPIRVTWYGVEEVEALNIRPLKWGTMPIVDECEERVIQVQDNQASKVIGDGPEDSGHPFDFVYEAKDPDYDALLTSGRFIPSFTPIETDNSPDYLLCPGCIFFYYQSPPDEYIKGSYFESILRIAGVKEWTFQKHVGVVSYTNGFETISKKLSITFIPKSDIPDGSCMTFEEV